MSDICMKWKLRKTKQQKYPKQTKPDIYKSVLSSKYWTMDRQSSNIGMWKI